MGRSASAVTAVIAAAGSGERLGAGGPKAFVEAGGRPLVAWSIEAMRGAPSVGRIVVACPPGVRLAAAGIDTGRQGEASPLPGGTSPGADVPSAGETPVVPEAPDEAVAADDVGAGELVEVDGGATRAQSVANALEAVETELVAIHDAARPLVTADLVEAVVAALASDPEAAGAIAATPVTDTVKRTSAAFDTHGVADAASAPDQAPVIASTVDRDTLWAAQTPQVFRVEALRQALRESDDVGAATDEAMLVEAAGGRVLIHPSPRENLKVTTPLDLRVAELLLAQR